MIQPPTISYFHTYRSPFSSLHRWNVNLTRRTLCQANFWLIIINELKLWLSENSAYHVPCIVYWTAATATILSLYFCHTVWAVFCFNSNWTFERWEDAMLSIGPYSLHFHISTRKSHVLRLWNHVISGLGSRSFTLLIETDLGSNKAFNLFYSSYVLLNRVNQYNQYQYIILCLLN